MRSPSRPETLFRRLQAFPLLLAVFAPVFFGCAGTRPEPSPRAVEAPAPEAMLLSGGSAFSQEAGGGEGADSRKAPSIDAASPSGGAESSRAGGTASLGPGSLTLDRAVREALAASPELEQVEHRIRAASEQIRQAEASFYPRITVSEEFNRTDNPVFALMNIINQRRFQPTIDFNRPGEQQNYSTKVQGEWMLFEGGGRWYERKAVVGVKRSLENELRAGRNDLVARVAETYYRWLNALEFIGVAEKALESAETDQRLGEARVRERTALSSELLRLKVGTAEARDRLVRARTGARKYQAALERLLARAIDPTEIPAPVPYAAGLPAFEGDSTDAAPDLAGEDFVRKDFVRKDLVRTALDRRPEMAAVKALVDAANERVKSARGGFLPRIGASLSTQSDSDKFAGNSGESWMMGLQASWPVFEGGITLARTREARARLKEAEARGRQVRLDISLEVNQAVLTLREALERVHVAEERAAWARKALEEVRNLYRNEVAAVDALLQAEVAWHEAEVSLAGAVFEVRIARALLKQALGDFAEGILAEPL